jgi:hypothetical protein
VALPAGPYTVKQAAMSPMGKTPWRLAWTKTQGMEENKGENFYRKGKEESAFGVSFVYDP